MNTVVTAKLTLESANGTDTFEITIRDHEGGYKVTQKIIADPLESDGFTEEQVDRLLEFSNSLLSDIAPDNLWDMEVFKHTYFWSLPHNNTTGKHLIVDEVYRRPARNSSAIGSFSII